MLLSAKRHFWETNIQNIITECLIFRHMVPIFLRFHHRFCDKRSYTWVKSGSKIILLWNYLKNLRRKKGLIFLKINFSLVGPFKKAVKGSPPTGFYLSVIQKSLPIAYTTTMLFKKTKKGIVPRGDFWNNPMGKITHHIVWNRWLYRFLPYVNCFLFIDSLFL